MEKVDVYSMIYQWYHDETKKCESQPTALLSYMVNAC